MPQHPQVFDPQSAAAEREWEKFLSRRNELLDDILGRLGIRGSILNPDSGVVFTGDLDTDRFLLDFYEKDVQQRAIQDSLNSDDPVQPVSPGNAGPGPLSNADLNELLGAADFYEIPNANQYTPDALQTLVETRRLQSRGDPTDDIGMLSYLGRTFYSGTIGELFDMAQRVPFMGDALAKRDWFNEADQWMGSLKESSLAAIAEDDETMFRVGFTGLGLVSYALPSTAIWKAAGAGLQALGVAGRVAPAFRYAIQGGLTAFSLEGGGDSPVGQRVVAIGLGSVFGGAIGVGGPVAGGAVGATVGAAVGSTIEPGPEGTVTGAVIGAVFGAALPMMLVKAQRSFTTSMAKPVVGTRQQARGSSSPFDDIPEGDPLNAGDTGKPPGSGY